jgi:magnesium-transporting ATPase (P-type)
MDLRKLLFIHGRSFAIKQQNFIQWSMFRSVLHVVFKISFNAFNQFSALQPIDGMLFVLFNITLTVLLPNAYVVFDQDLKIPTSLNVPKLYVLCRNEIKSFFKVYWTNFAIASFYGWAVYSVYFFTAGTADLGEG